MAQVQVREMPRLIALRPLGTFQPGNRFVQQPELHHVNANVVVGVAELRINSNGLAAVFYRLLQHAQERNRPSSVGVPFSRWTRKQALIETVHSRLNASLQQLLHAFLPEFASPFFVTKSWIGCHGFAPP